MWHTAWFKPLGILLGISFFFLESFGSARWQAYHPGLFADTKVVENNTDGVRRRPLRSARNSTAGTRSPRDRRDTPD